MENVSLLARLAIVSRLRFARALASIPLFLYVLLGLPMLGFGQDTFAVPFTYQIGGSVPSAKSYDVFSPTPVALTLVKDSATWVSASLSSNNTPSVLTISVTPTSLLAGTYTSTLKVDS